MYSRGQSYLDGGVYCRKEQTDKFPPVYNGNLNNTYGCEKKNECREPDKHDNYNDKGILSSIRRKLSVVEDDDILLLGLFIILINEDSEDNFLALIILAVLLLS